MVSGRNPDQDETGCMLWFFEVKRKTIYTYIYFARKAFVILSYMIIWLIRLYVKTYDLSVRVGIAT